MAFGLGVARSMLSVLSHLGRKPVTIQYPEEPLPMPIWTRGRPRLIFEIDTGELRCTACGACALACPVDVIKIEQHPNPVGKGKVLDRFEIDMAGCIECAFCVEACPFRAITMAADFEMAAFERTTELVYGIPELRIAGTPEVDAGMEHIQGVKRGLRGQAAPAAKAAPKAAPAAARPAAPAAARPAAPAAPTSPGPVAGQGTGATAAPVSQSSTGNQVAEPAAAPAAAVASGQGEDRQAAAAAAAAKAPTTATAPTNYDPLTISDEDLKKLPPAERGKVYKARLMAKGWQPPKQS